jgi:2-methylcitrate dehydratase PrpD
MGGDPARVVQDLGRRWFVSELAHKPYPSGRATHGIIEACLRLRRRPGCEAALIDRITAHVPPLVHRLVARPPLELMSVNYARLCAPYLTARALIEGTIGFDDFTPDAYRNAETRGLARRVSIKVRDTGDPNALTPVKVEIALRDGSRHVTDVDVVYGNPRKPLAREDHLAKFRRNCASAAQPVPLDAVEGLIEGVERLEAMADVAELADLLCARGCRDQMQR